MEKLPKPYHDVSNIVEICFLAIVVLLGLPLNIYSLIMTGQKCQSNRTKISSFIHLRLHLNIADLLIICCYALPTFCWLCTYYWLGPLWLCPFIKYMQVFAFSLHSNTIICIAVDRAILSYRLTRKMPQWENTQRRTLITVSVSYILAFVTAFGQLILFKATDATYFFFHDLHELNMLPPEKKLKDYQPVYQCIGMQTFLDMKNQTNKGTYQPSNYELFAIKFAKYYECTQLVMQYWLPLILIIGSYVFIVFSLKREIRWLSAAMSPDTTKINATTMNIYELKDVDKSNTDASTDPSTAINDFRKSNKLDETVIEDAGNELNTLLDRNQINRCSAKVSYNESQISLPHSTSENAAKKNSRKRKRQQSWSKRKPSSITILSIVSGILSRQYHSKSLHYSNVDRKAHISTKTVTSYADATLTSAKNRATRKAVYIVLAYLVCWTPYFIWALVARINKGADWLIAVEKWTIFINSFITLNSVLNPVIYGIYI